jgi:hypothetical protein
MGNLKEENLFQQCLYRIPSSLSLMIKFLSSWYREGSFYMGTLSQEEKERSKHSSWDVF